MLSSSMQDDYQLVDSSWVAYKSLTWLGFFISSRTRRNLTTTKATPAIMKSRPIPPAALAPKITAACFPVFPVSAWKMKEFFLDEVRVEIFQAKVICSLFIELVKRTLNFMSIHISLLSLCMLCINVLLRGPKIHVCTWPNSVPTSFFWRRYWLIDWLPFSSPFLSMICMGPWLTL